MSKIITVNRKGMITIPVNIRKKYNIKENSKLVILDIDGKLEIIPIYEDFSKLQQNLSSREKIKESIKQSIDIELKIEGAD
ncbi:MAG: AbrB/MazE/SpoVT family DNA-binding domain-containing protein [Candidatus Lokiarchaeota archaeon]|nr:AbrB/MazE/SpoVT family DNA-binding domain-containing protein [Candidatus Harpocratesius repetitus]